MASTSTGGLRIVKKSWLVPTASTPQRCRAASKLPRASQGSHADRNRQMLEQRADGPCFNGIVAFARKSFKAGDALAHGVPRKTRTASMGS